METNLRGPLRKEGANSNTPTLNALSPALYAEIATKLRLDTGSFLRLSE